MFTAFFFTQHVLIEWEIQGKMAWQYRAYDLGERLQLDYPTDMLQLAFIKKIKKCVAKQISETQSLQGEALHILRRCRNDIAFFTYYLFVHLGLRGFWKRTAVKTWLILLFFLTPFLRSEPIEKGLQAPVASCWRPARPLTRPAVENAENRYKFHNCELQIKQLISA